MTVAIDTNCLLRWLLGDVPEQAALVDQFMQNQDNFVHVADLAVAELVWVLQSVYELTRPEIAELVTLITSNSRINCNRQLFEVVLPVYLEHPGVSFVGACLASYVTLSEAEKLLTFDKKLVRTLPLLAVHP